MFGNSLCSMFSPVFCRIRCKVPGATGEAENTRVSTFTPRTPRLQFAIIFPQVSFSRTMVSMLGAYKSMVHTAHMGLIIIRVSVHILQRSSCVRNQSMRNLTGGGGYIRQHNFGPHTFIPCYLQLCRSVPLEQDSYGYIYYKVE
jgi:hypothetical protein